jgi:hypothetical protein
MHDHIPDPELRLRRLRERYPTGSLVRKRGVPGVVIDVTIVRSAPAVYVRWDTGRRELVLASQLVTTVVAA